MAKSKKAKTPKPKAAKKEPKPKSKEGKKKGSKKSKKQPLSKRDMELAKIRSEKEEQERLKREAEEKAAADKKLAIEQALRAGHLVQSVSIIQTYDKWVIGKVARQKSLHEWNTFKACRNLPDFAKLYEVNSYLSYWLNQLEPPLMKKLLRLSPEFLQLIHEMRDFLEIPPDNIRLDLIRELGLLYRDMVNYQHVYLDKCTYAIMEDLTDFFDPEVGVCDYLLSIPEITHCLWGNLFACPDINQHEFQELQFKFKIPETLLTAHGIYRLVKTEYDHFSDSCMSYFAPGVENALKQSILDWIELHALATVDFTELQSPEDAKSRKTVKDKQEGKKKGKKKRKGSKKRGKSGKGKKKGKRGKSGSTSGGDTEYEEMDEETRKFMQEMEADNKNAKKKEKKAKAKKAKGKKGKKTKNGDTSTDYSTGYTTTDTEAAEEEENEGEDESAEKDAQKVYTESDFETATKETKEERRARRRREAEEASEAEFDFSMDKDDRNDDSNAYDDDDDKSVHRKRKEGSESEGSKQEAVKVVKKEEEVHTKKSKKLKGKGAKEKLEVEEVKHKSKSVLKPPVDDDSDEDDIKSKKRSMASRQSTRKSNVARKSDVPRKSEASRKSEAADSQRKSEASRKSVGNEEGQEPDGDRKRSTVADTKNVKSNSKEGSINAGKEGSKRKSKAKSKGKSKGKKKKGSKSKSKGSKKNKGKKSKSKSAKKGKAKGRESEDDEEKMYGSAKAKKALESARSKIKDEGKAAKSKKKKGSKSKTPKKGASKDKSSKTKKEKANKPKSKSKTKAKPKSKTDASNTRGRSKEKRSAKKSSAGSKSKSKSASRSRSKTPKTGKGRSRSKSGSKGRKSKSRSRSGSKGKKKGKKKKGGAGKSKSKERPKTEAELAKERERAEKAKFIPQLHDHEMNLRNYTILGGVYNFNLLEIPPQPRTRGNWIIHLKESDTALKEVPFEADYTPPTPLDQESAKKTPEEMEKEAKRQEEELQKLVLVDMALPPTVSFPSAMTEEDEEDEALRLQKEQEESLAAFEAEKERRFSQLITVEVTAPRIALWFEPPTPVRWDPIKRIWSTDGFFDIKFNENNLQLSFKTVRFGIMGFGHNRWSNLPYQSWELRPLGKDKVSFSLVAAMAVLEFIVMGDLICLSSLDNVTNADEVQTALLNKYMKPKHLIKEMRYHGLDIFPEIDSYAYVDGVLVKHFEAEDHLYQCMALVSSAFNFQWSRWNLLAGREKMVYQMRERHGTSTPGNYSMVLTTPRKAIRINCTEVSPNYTEDPVVDFEYYADLLNLVRAVGTDSGLKVINQTNPHYVEALRVLLTSIRPLSFS